ncbi:DUF1697 domain-containing protein [Vallitalea pronyensis]|uniref:DUF1697 domain-containing protein n=1 Tax=Vallitalea pronyensis TaxID=1348613 RepID=A0A8J8MNI9_9FIRM|nr:DUF1697 domain-containing protein [Vallitalea pronyensis]QUI24724.1 DUF1697 domain-containing protein [Vallitalea pronyensis]
MSYERRDLMIYCAFFRGVNVNGVKMTMGVIKERFEKLGFCEVTTVLATGNVIFAENEGLHASAIVKQIEDDLSLYYNRQVYIFLKTDEDVKHIIEYAMDYDTKKYNLYWMLVDTAIHRKKIVDEYDTTTAIEGEQIAIKGGELYWLVPKGYTLKTPFGKLLGKKKYQAHLTSRNLNTIKKVLSKMQSS